MDFKFSYLLLHMLYTFYLGPPLPQTSFCATLSYKIVFYCVGALVSTLEEYQITQTRVQTKNMLDLVTISENPIKIMFT